MKHAILTLAVIWVLLDFANAAPPPISPSPPAVHICWIESVRVEQAAVRVTFSPTAYNIRGATHTQGQFVIGHDNIVWLSGPKDGQSEPGLLMTHDETATLMQGVEDTCGIAFAEENGKPGITAHASFSVPPWPPSESTVFIPAED